MRRQTTHRSPALSLRQAAARIAAGVALGGALAVAIVSSGVPASGAVVRPGAPGTASSRLGALRAGAVAKAAPPDVSAGLGAGSADAASARLLASNAAGSGLDLYAAGRASGGACNALAIPAGGVSTQCVDDLPPSGISLQAADAAGWTLYGFAADDVVGVDVILHGEPRPATMLRNAYMARLGAAEPGDVSALTVHYADGTTATVANDLRAPGA